MTNNMTVGSPTKLVIKFIIPLLIGNIIQQFYTTVDTIIVGKYLGTNALAGVGSAGAIIFFIIGFAMGMTSGFAVPIAQRFGAGDYSKMRNYIMISIYLCIGISIIMTVGSLIILNPLLVFMQTPDDIYTYSYEYLAVIIIGIFTSIAYNMTASILRSLGDSKTPLYFLIISALLNIVLDLVFIVTFNMGVAGAALATVISQGVSALLCMIYMVKRFEILKIQKGEMRYDQQGANLLVKIGFPMAFQYSIIAIGSILLQSAVNSLGTVYIASYTVCCKIEQLAIQPFVTLGIASTTYVGQNIGAGRLDRVKEGMKKMTIIGIIMAILCGAIVYIVQEPLISIFIQKGDDLNLIIEYSKQYLIWASAFFVPLMLLILYRGALQGMSEAIVPLWIGIVELFSRVIVAKGFVKMLGYFAICLACPVAWLGGAIVAVTAYFKKIKKLQIIEEDKDIIHEALQ